jgi:lipopolysaccharide/colanic/teichoic acid biosynthesis glycosyltransferase
LIKRCTDLIISLVGLIIFFPVFFLISLIILTTIRLPIIFKQTRPGFLGSPFTFYKFRTMTQEKDTNGKLLPDVTRLTKFGKFLRNTSMDELPSLWNVLKGEMSFVGPRPLLMEYLDYYSPGQTRRHDVKPGITGWAQINGRNTISWEEKFELDLWYVNNQSLKLDIKILLITIKKVLFQENINKSNSITMEKFKGYR